MNRLLSTKPSSLPKKTTLNDVLPIGGILCTKTYIKDKKTYLNHNITLSSKKELWKCTVFPEIDVMSMLLLSMLNKVTFSIWGTPRGLKTLNAINTVTYEHNVTLI